MCSFPPTPQTYLQGRKPAALHAFFNGLLPEKDHRFKGGDETIVLGVAVIEI